MINNQATGNGGAIYVNGGTVNVLHQSIISNTAENNGGGIYNGAGNMVISNTLFVGNIADTGGAIYGQQNNISMDYNLYYVNEANNNPISNRNTGSNSLFTNPELVNDFELPSGSPAVDTGDPSSTVFEDYQGEGRPTNQGFDIGADELAGCFVRINLELPTYFNIEEPLSLAQDGDELDIAGYCRGGYFA